MEVDAAAAQADEGFLERTWWDQLRQLKVALASNSHGAAANQVNGLDAVGQVVVTTCLTGGGSLSEIFSPKNQNALNELHRWFAGAGRIGTATGGDKDSDIEFPDVIA